MNIQTNLVGAEHWTSKGDVKLFLWNKCAGDPARSAGTILFVHGSSMASQPTFDLDVPERPDSSATVFARVWVCFSRPTRRSTRGRQERVSRHRIFQEQPRSLEGFLSRETCLEIAARRHRQ